MSHSTVCAKRDQFSYQLPTVNRSDDFFCPDFICLVLNKHCMLKNHSSLGVSENEPFELITKDVKFVCKIFPNIQASGSVNHGLNNFIIAFIYSKQYLFISRKIHKREKIKLLPQRVSGKRLIICQGVIALVSRLMCIHLKTQKSSCISSLSRRGKYYICSLPCVPSSSSYLSLRSKLLRYHSNITLTQQPKDTSKWLLLLVGFRTQSDFGNLPF